MLKPRKIYQLDCYLHPVKVKGVSQRYLDKIVAGKNETVRGCYIAKENTIYIAYDLEQEVLEHTLWHEWKHAWDEHTEDLDDEKQADAFGAIMRRLGVNLTEHLK